MVLIKTVSIRKVKDFHYFWFYHVNQEEKDDATNCFGDIHEYIKDNNIGREIEVMEHILITRSQIYLLEQDENDEFGYILLEYHRKD